MQAIRKVSHTLLSFLPPPATRQPLSYSITGLLTRKLKLVANSQRIRDTQEKEGKEEENRRAIKTAASLKTASIFLPFVRPTESRVIFQIFRDDNDSPCYLK